MNIQQLSANIDQKLSQLEQKTRTLKLQQSSDDGNDEQLAKDMAALEKIKRKLQKSRDIMWQAHHLQRTNDDKMLGQKRLLGIGLCIFSGLGLLSIALVVAFR